MGIIVICMLLGLLIIPMIGIFTFEYVRALTMHAQLKHAVQAAALAGVARLASSDELDPMVSHQRAMNSARTIFKANFVNQYPLAGATDATTPDNDPGPNDSSIFVEFLNPKNNYQSVELGNTDGHVVHAVGAFGLVPVFTRFFQIGLGGPYTIRAEGWGEVPDIDIALSFDTSGSIDDQTPISIVHYLWDKTASPERVRIRVANNGAASGLMFDLTNPVPTGTGLNAEFIQNLGSDQNRHPYRFQPSIRNTASVNGPPGNHPTVSMTQYTNYNPSPTHSTNRWHYTHFLVNTNVDSDNKAVYPMFFGSVRVDNVYEHCALASGWLDSTAAFNQARLNTCPEIDITPFSGAKNQYLQAIVPHIQPIGAAQEAAQQFFTILNNNTDSHFAFCSFNTNAASSPTQKKTGWRVSSSYTTAGQGSYADPGVPMDKNDSKYTEIFNLIPQTIAEGSTNISGSINRCKGWIQTGGRPGAEGAIVVFTDGQPNAGGGIPGAYTAADSCKDLGITIHAIGLAQNSSVIPAEVDTLNNQENIPVSYTDQNGSTQTYTPSEKGIAGRGASKGQFYLVQDKQNLRYVFENLARRLVQIVKIK